MTMNECYPKRKIFRLQAHETWLMGLYNTCGIESEKGVQVFGTCCPHDKKEAERVNEVKTRENSKLAKKQPCLLNSSQKKRVKSTKCTKNNSGQTRVQEFAKIVQDITSVDLTKIVGGVFATAHEYKFIVRRSLMDCLRF